MAGNGPTKTSQRFNPIRCVRESDRYLSAYRHAAAVCTGAQWLFSQLDHSKQPGAGTQGTFFLRAFTGNLRPPARSLSGMLLSFSKASALSNLESQPHAAGKPFMGSEA